MAAVTILGRRPLIWRGPDRGELPPEAVRDRDLQALARVLHRMQVCGGVICFALFALALNACGTVQASKPAVEVDMRNVDLHITPQICATRPLLLGDL